MTDLQTQKQEKWVWIDLEMTGLDEKECVILQVAMIITDSGLNTLAEVDVPVWQPESALAKMVPIVRSMHTRNGLLDRVRTSDHSLAQAQEILLSTLAKHVECKKGILAGNSMYIDRRFLQKYMPALEGYLHYRQIDVSSLKILAQAWFGNKGIPPKKPSSHTALEDIKDSINELAFYKDNIFSLPH